MGGHPQKPINIFIIVAIVDMSTISVKEDVKEDLLRYASELQVKMGRRVDFNEAIRFLLRERRKHPSLLSEACAPAAGAEEAKRALMEERRLDEERAERRLRR
ncbi:hypothetical protein KAT55_04295 [Candidatus Bathyarchaeota archaeon]|nr:hypothetical protein [Candidatus Bathyarchaeota archaeon]